MILLFLRLLLGILVFLRVAVVSAQSASNTGPQVDDLKHQAEQDLQQQKPQLAIPLFRQILSLDPQNLEARGNLGVLLYFQNNYPEAITEMRAALQLQPALWRIKALLGIAEQRTGDLAAAEADLEGSLSNLDDAKIRKEAGLAFIEITTSTGELDRAAAVAAMLEKNAPRDPQILFVSYQISLQMVERTLLSLALAAPNSAELHMMMAEQLLLQHDTSDAIAQYREAIRINPKLPGVHFELATQLEDSSDPGVKAQAEHEFRTALSLNQFDEKAWRGLGRIMADKGDSAAARECYTKALALIPRDADAETDLAKLLSMRGDTKAATLLLESAVKDDPTNIVAHYQLSGVYRQAGRAAESQHEMEEFNHYKVLKSKLGKVFLQVHQQDGQAGENPQPSPHASQSSPELP